MKRIFRLSKNESSRRFLKPNTIPKYKVIQKCLTTTGTYDTQQKISNIEKYFQTDDIEWNENEEYIELHKLIDKLNGKISVLEEENLILDNENKALKNKSCTCGIMKCFNIDQQEFISNKDT